MLKIRFIFTHYQLLIYILLSMACSESVLNNEDMSVGSTNPTIPPQVIGNTINADRGVAPVQPLNDMFMIPPNTTPGLSIGCQPTLEECDALDNDCDGLVDEEQSCACVGDSACYGGPPLSRGVGLCRDGSRVCDERGETWEACQGWQGPVAENCTGGVDEDCDGVIDEQDCIEFCTPGQTRNCYSGPAGTEGVSFCIGGTQVCLDNEEWGVCEGEQLPQQEICDDGIDNDCDGILDTDCYDDLPTVVDERRVGVDIEERPVDFIMAIDNSGSMRDTVALIENNLGVFAQRLVNSGVDYRLVIVSKREDDNGTSVCIPEPLAGPNCSDNNNFLHLDERVGSSSAFKDILDCYEGCEQGRGFSGFLRDRSLRQVIVVTDDESRLTWNDFRTQLQGFIGDFILHGVIGTRNDNCVAEVGSRYLEGIQETQGEALHICDGDWGQVINILLEATLSRLQTRFSLSQAPIVDTIQVSLQIPGGEEVINPNNWRYIEGDQVIELINFEVEANRVVIIRYTPRT